MNAVFPPKGSTMVLPHPVYLKNTVLQHRLNIVDHTYIINPLNTVLQHRLNIVDHTYIINPLNTVLQHRLNIVDHYIINPLNTD